MAIAVDAILHAHVDVVAQTAEATVVRPNGTKVRRIVERTGRGLGLTAAQLRALLVLSLRQSLGDGPAHEPAFAQLLAGDV